ncbi:MULTISPECIES: DUF2523 domain-containing protein [unclassified Acinetobacter]|uniref:DUF2523 domain-containing protein n=1 Tax=unclassified Acinetobacter TaxID=196816 RepID=UPI0035B8990D
MADFPSLNAMLYSVGESLLSVSVKKVLSGAGLGLVTYAGMTKALEKIISDANAQLSQGDGAVLSILGLGGIDTCLSIILSACVIRMTIYGSQIRIIKSD